MTHFSSLSIVSTRDLRYSKVFSAMLLNLTTRCLLWSTGIAVLLARYLIWYAVIKNRLSLISKKRFPLNLKVKTQQINLEKVPKKVFTKFKGKNFTGCS